MLKKLEVTTLSIDSVNEKIKNRDLIYNSIEKILKINVKDFIKFKNIKNGDIRLISNNPNIAQEILLRRTEIIDILQKKYPDEINDLKIRIGKI